MNPWKRPIRMWVCRIGRISISQGERRNERPEYKAAINYTARRPAFSRPPAASMSRVSSLVLLCWYSPPPHISQSRSNLGIASEEITRAVCRFSSSSYICCSPPGVGTSMSKVLSSDRGPGLTARTGTEVLRPRSSRSSK